MISNFKRTKLSIIVLILRIKFILEPMKIILTYISTFILIYNVSAQEGPKVVVFNSDSSTGSSEYTGGQNLLKLSVLEAFSGDISLYYERVLNENTSVEGGLGLTITDYFSAFVGNFDFQSSDESYQPLLGFSFGAGFRYYPWRSPEEFYFAGEMKYRYYHNNQYINLNQVNEEVYEESLRLFLPRITVGYLYFFDDKIFADLAAGVGIGSARQVNYQEIYDPVSGLTTGGLKESSTLFPRFHLSLKIGFTF